MLTHIGQEVRQQLAEGGEPIGFLLVAVVPVIAFAGLVVVADQPLSAVAVEQGILEQVRGARNGGGDLPKLQLQNRAVIIAALAMEDQRRLRHRTHNDIGGLCRQLT